MTAFTFLAAYRMPSPLPPASPSFSGEIEVAPDGTLHHPRLNRVVVAGIPLDSVRARIITFLSDHQREPAVDIKPLARIVVSGEVRPPPGCICSPPKPPWPTPW